MRAMRSLPARAAAALVSASLFLSACGGDEEPASSPGEPGESQTAEAEEPQTWPLTGERAKRSTAKRHPVLVVKMDNTSKAAPQVGLGSADLVVEELVEGNLTRLAAFFYSSIPDEVGPVRSMRASDIGIVSPAGGHLVASGAAAPTIQRLNDSKVTFHQEGSSAGFRRESSRPSLYSVMADLGALADKVALAEPQRPDDYLPWGTAEDLPKGRPARTLTADFGGHATNWAFQGGRYVNQNSFAAEGDEFQADTVLALRVEVGDAGYLDPGNNFVPETKFEGKGKALLFHGGRVVRGTWSKDGLDGALSLATADGKQLSVPAGKVWIELVPANNAGGRIQPGSVNFQR